MSSVEMVFFDAGETLIRPYPSFPELFAEVCARRGVAVEAATVSEVQERLAPHLVDIAEDTGVTAPSLDPDDSRVFWMFLYRRLLEELEIDDPALPDDLYATFSASTTYRVFDDVIPVLQRLEEDGFRLGLISNFEGWLQNVLVEQELGETFDVSIISGLEGVEKPDPRIYQVAIERAGIEPHKAVHIGDSMSLDVLPATEVGMTAVLLDRAGRYPDPGCPAIATLKDLPALVSKL